MSTSEETLDINTPENVAIGYQVAGLGSRFLATLLDTLIIVLLQVIVSVAFLVIINGLDNRDVSGGLSGWVYAAYGIVNFLFYWGYYIFFEMLWNGQSPGTFSFNSTTFAYTVLFNLSSADGSVPYAELMQNGTGGLLYGTTSEGGANGQGVIFSFDLTGNLYARLVDLSPALGYRPLGRLRRAANGLLYVTTSLSGTSSLGVLFSYDPDTSTYTLLKT